MGVFHVGEDGFHVIAAPFAFPDAFVAFKEFPDFFPVPLQIVVALQTSVVFRAVAHAAYRAAFAVFCLVVRKFLLKAVLGSPAAFVGFLHPLPHRADVKILFSVVMQMLFTEGLVL